MSWDAYITDHLMVRSNTDADVFASCCSTALLLLGCFCCWAGASFKLLGWCRRGKRGESSGMPQHQEVGLPLALYCQWPV